MSPLEEDVRANLVTTKVIEVSGNFVSNQTDHFTITSSKENKYIMVMYDNDSNKIIADPIKNRSQTEIVRVQVKMHTYITDRGFKPLVQVLDNECPNKLRKYFQQRNINFQLEPLCTSIAPMPQNDQYPPTQII